MGAQVLATIERLRKSPWVVLALLFASAVGALSQFTGATKALVELFHQAKSDPRAELAKLGISFTPEALVQAAKDGDTRAAQLLIDAGMTADAGMPTHVDAPVDGDSPLVAAAAGEHVETFKALVAAGADITRTNDAGWSAFDLMAMQGHVDAVRFVLARKPAQAVIDKAFKAAAWGGADGVATAQLLAPHVSNLRRRASDALAAIAGEKRDVAMARLLLSLGASPVALDQGVSAIHAAAAHDEGDLVRMLLHAGAPVDQPGRCIDWQKDVSTPLWCAADYGVAKTAAILLAAGANPNARGPDGTTPLVRAAERLEDPALIELLLKAGADPSVRTNDGKTVLDRARAAIQPNSGDQAIEAAILKRLEDALNRASAQRRS